MIVKGEERHKAKQQLCVGLFRDMPGRIPWDTSLERISPEELQASPAPPVLEQVMKKIS